jgi:hypothetical protein
MKLNKVIAELQNLAKQIQEVGGNPNDSEVVIHHPDLEYTADIDFSVDDENNIEIFVTADAKPF